MTAVVVGGALVVTPIISVSNLVLDVTFVVLGWLVLRSVVPARSRAVRRA